MVSHPFCPMSQGHSGLAHRSTASSWHSVGTDRMCGAMTQAEPSETFVRFGGWSSFTSRAARLRAVCGLFLSLRTEAAWKTTQYTEEKRVKRRRKREPENVMETLGPMCLQPTRLGLPGYWSHYMFLKLKLVWAGFLAFATKGLWLTQFIKYKCLAQRKHKIIGSSVYYH